MPLDSLDSLDLLLQRLIWLLCSFCLCRFCLLLCRFCLFHFSIRFLFLPRVVCSTAVAAAVLWRIRSVAAAAVLWGVVVLGRRSSKAVAVVAVDVAVARPVAPIVVVVIVVARPIVAHSGTAADPGALRHPQWGLLRRVCPLSQPLLPVVAAADLQQICRSGRHFLHYELEVVPRLLHGLRPEVVQLAYVQVERLLALELLRHPLVRALHVQQVVVAPGHSLLPDLLQRRHASSRDGVEVPVAHVRRGHRRHRGVEVVARYELVVLAVQKVHELVVHLVVRRRLVVAQRLPGEVLVARTLLCAIWQVAHHGLELLQLGVLVRGGPPVQQLEADRPVSAAPAPRHGSRNDRIFSETVIVTCRDLPRSSRSGSATDR